MTMMMTVMMMMIMMIDHDDKNDGFGDNCNGFGI